MKGFTLQLKAKKLTSKATKIKREENQIGKFSQSILFNSESV